MASVFVAASLPVGRPHVKLRVWNELDGYHTYIHVRYEMGFKKKQARGCKGKGMQAIVSPRR